MINETMLFELGLTEEQTRTVLDAVQSERSYHTLLLEEGISPRIALKIINATELDEILDESEDLLRLKISEEWRGFMRNEK